MDDIRIGEVARRVGVSPSTLRAWERKGTGAPVARGWAPSPLHVGGHRSAPRRSRAADSRVRRRRPSTRSSPAKRIPDDPVVGKRLRAARTKRSLSLRGAAERAGISASYLSLVERGLAEPSVSLLQRVASAYGGTLLEFFGAAPGRCRGSEARPQHRAPPAARIRPRRDRGPRDVSQCRARDRHLQRRTRAAGAAAPTPTTAKRRSTCSAASSTYGSTRREHYHIETGRHPLLPKRPAASLDRTTPATTTRLFWVNTPPTF